MSDESLEEIDYTLQNFDNKRKKQRVNNKNYRANLKSVNLSKPETIEKIKTTTSYNIINPITQSRIEPTNNFLNNESASNEILNYQVFSD